MQKRVYMGLEILLQIMVFISRDWDCVPPNSSPFQRLEIALEASFFPIAYTLALRGEEVPLAEIKRIRRHWSQGLTHILPSRISQ
jgi:hypothetical protein